MVTIELIRAALQHISPNLTRDEWARVAMAIKSEFPDQAGCDLFTDWSSTADGFDLKATKSTWRSVKAGGGVGIGTLLRLAKESGFVMPTAGTAPSKPDPAAAAHIARERAAAQQLEKAQQQAAHAHAAHDAENLWGSGSDTGESAYLSRKGVQPHGVRFGADGWLLVPLRDAGSTLWNVQRIAPTKPKNGTDKLFIKGGRKSGLWHWCGDPSGAGVLLIAEGYATAASLHEAVGRPVAVAFDAGNLVHVAKALHGQYPDALLAVCGDDDIQTLAKTGHNPGRDKATAAAKAVQGVAVFPEGLPNGGTDFNDMHQAVGLEAVRLVVDSAIDSYEPPQQAAAVKSALGTKAAVKATKGNVSSRQSSADDPDHGRILNRFSVDDSGVWFNGVDKDGQGKPPEWVCSALQVNALTRDQDGGGWGYLLVFDDPLGHAKQWAMPARMLSGDGGEYRSTLLSMGLRIAASPRARSLLTQFIQTRKPEEFATCTDRIGWHNGQAFVLPRTTIGDDAERIYFQTDKIIENTFAINGSTDKWRDRIGALCAGNSRLVFAVACAFAGPLLRPVGEESGGFHMVGDSSTGKTTSLQVARSVFGGESFKRTWSGTGVGFEVAAASTCDTLLVLDELKECDPKIAGQVIYSLGNEQGRMRGNAGLQMRPMVRWKLLFLSSGELTLEQHLAGGNIRINEGQKTRLANIPADAGAGFGLFENLHGYVKGNGAEFSKHLTDQTKAAYGATGRAWLEWCSANADTLKASTRSAVSALSASMIPEGGGGQVQRVGARFALVGAAGEMATAAGLTGWPAGESERAARACFAAWLSARGGVGNGEVTAMLRAVRRFIALHGEGRFSWWHRAADDHNSKTLNRAGYRRLLSDDGTPIKTHSDHQREYGDRMPAVLSIDTRSEFFIFTDVFREEICKDYNHLAVCRALLEHGCITPEYKAAPDAGVVHRFDTSHRLPALNKHTRCYRIPDTILSLEL